MIFGLGGNRRQPVELDAAGLQALLTAGEALVVDVREPGEFAAGHIPGAVNVPLSSFEPSKLPAADGKRLVLACQAGRRSAKALDRCGVARAEIDTHLRGGFGAWQAARLPVER